jgi:RNA recognition motif-containing protein
MADHKEIKKMEVKLYVGNLPYDTTEEDLRTLFAQAGTVTSVAVIRDRDTGRSKGFGFVEMGSQADAQNAITKFNSYRIGDRTLTVNPARPREERAAAVAVMAAVAAVMVAAVAVAVAVTVAVVAAAAMQSQRWGSTLLVETQRHTVASYRTTIG